MSKKKETPPEPEKKDYIFLKVLGETLLEVGAFTLGLFCYIIGKPLVWLGDKCSQYIREKNELKKLEKLIETFTENGVD